MEWGRTQGNRLESVRERARGASTRYLSDSEMSDRQARGRARSIAMHGERDSEWAKKRLGGRGLTRRAAVSRSSAVPHQAKAATSGDFREACLGRTFHWSEDGSSENGTVETYRDETVRSNIVRVRMDVDEQVILPTAGYLLTGI